MNEEKTIRNLLDTPGWDAGRGRTLERLMRRAWAAEMNQMMCAVWGYGAAFHGSKDHAGRNDQKNS